jgi:hypothetical protein
MEPRAGVWDVIEVERREREDREPQNHAGKLR